MARVRDIPASELPADLAGIYKKFAGSYGPFRNQVAVFAHVPAALRHLMPLLMELREAKTLPKRALELAIVTVSQLNACHYCVAHHKPFLVVEGVSPGGVDCLLDYRDHPELDEVDRLVVEYAIAAWERTPAAPFQRGADRRTDLAHHAVRLLQQIQRRARDRRRTRGCRTARGDQVARGKRS
jgi:AhpD family alkylhydroperoxidase